MYIVAWIFIVLATSSILIMFTSISMEFQILKDKTNDEIIIHIKAIFGLIQYKIELPLLDLIEKQDGSYSLEVNEEIESEKSEKLMNENKQLFSLSQLQELQDRASKLFNQYFSVLNYIRRKLRICNLNWETEFGTGDAAVTGILTGILWGIKGNLFSMMKRHIRSDDISFKIIPYFDKELLKTYIHCIIKLKIGHAIIATIKTAYLYLKRGDKQNVKSSN